MTSSMKAKFDVLFTIMERNKAYPVLTLDGSRYEVNFSILKGWVAYFDSFGKREKKHVLSYANQIWQQVKNR